MEAKHWVAVEFPAGQDLGRQLREIKRERRTGSLTIGFQEGAPVGEFTWKQRLKGQQSLYSAPVGLPGTAIVA
jgi:hypothetical protein